MALFVTKNKKKIKKIKKIPKKIKHQEPLQPFYNWRYCSHPVHLSCLEKDIQFLSNNTYTYCPGCGENPLLGIEVKEFLKISSSPPPPPLPLPLVKRPNALQNFCGLCESKQPQLNTPWIIKGSPGKPTLISWKDGFVMALHQNVHEKTLVTLNLTHLTESSQVWNFQGEVSQDFIQSLLQGEIPIIIMRGSNQSGTPYCADIQLSPVTSLQQGKLLRTQLLQLKGW